MFAERHTLVAPVVKSPYVLLTASCVCSHMGPRQPCAMTLKACLACFGLF